MVRTKVPQSCWWLLKAYDLVVGNVDEQKNRTIVFWLIRDSVHSTIRPIRITKLLLSLDSDEMKIENLRKKAETKFN